jgi:hypothetical protein
VNVYLEQNLGQPKDKFFCPGFSPVRPAIPNMSVYPIVKLPRKIKKAYQSEVAMPIFASQPLLQNPGQPPRRFNFWVLGAEAFLAVLLSGVANYVMGYFVAGAVLISGLLFLLAHVGGMQASYSNRWYEYHQQMDRFRRQQWENEFDRTRHERLQTQDGINSYRRHRVAEVLAQTMTPEEVVEDLASLPTAFITTLSRWFPDKIHGGIGSGLMLIDQSSRLHISIAIDAIPQRVAGVAAGSFIEDDRNLHQGWVVVRFNADQVRNYPDSCCKTLAEIASELLQNPAWLQPFTDVYDLWQVPDDFAQSSFPTLEKEFNEVAHPFQSQDIGR